MNQGGLFNRLKIWKSGEALRASDINLELNNIVQHLSPQYIQGLSGTLAQMQATTNPGGLGSENLQTTLAGEIQTLRYVIGKITGQSPWYQPPTYNLTQLQFSSQNFLLNPNFNIFQAGIPVSQTLQAAADIQNVYAADQWYLQTYDPAGSGVLTYGIPGSSLGVTGLSIAPSTAYSKNGSWALFQTIPFLDSLALYDAIGGSPLSFLTVDIEPTGYVNQIGLQFFFSQGTNDSKVSIPVGSEQVFSVSSGTRVTLSSTAVALPNIFNGSTAGNYGVRIRPIGVTTGSLNAVGNGFEIFNAAVTAGNAPADFSKVMRSYSEEVLRCQYLYEKSYPLATTPGSGASLVGGDWFLSGDSANLQVHTVFPFKVSKRALPGISFWDMAGNLSKYSAYSTSNTLVNSVTGGVVASASPVCFNFYTVGASISAGIQWVADSRI